MPETETRDELDELLTVSEAAALLGVTRMRVHQIIEAGGLAALRLRPHGRIKGIKRYIRGADVERYRAARRQGYAGGPGAGSNDR